MMHFRELGKTAGGSYVTHPENKTALQDSTSKDTAKQTGKHDRKCFNFYYKKRKKMTRNVINLMSQVSSQLVKAQNRKSDLLLHLCFCLSSQFPLPVMPFI